MTKICLNVDKYHDEESKKFHLKMVDRIKNFIKHTKFNGMMCATLKPLEIEELLKSVGESDLSSELIQGVKMFNDFL